VAIQEIEVKDAHGTAGIQRNINHAAKGMVMDIVQSQQYQKPIPSTVRELAANAVDAQSEKEKALEILSGKCSPDKYFIQRDGDLYKDSNWNPEYYDVNYLNASKNEVELIFKKGKEDIGRCDRFIVRDYGVGIGKRRLQGVLEVGYSTKRNRKDALGAFGLGAKVGLSTGAEYYNLTTVYNGVKYKVKVFNKKINDLVGKFNLEKGEENVPYYFHLDNEESKEIIGTIYGEKTDELNYTEIEIPVMRHYRSDFDTAVKTQLLFFKNVKYYHEEIDGSRSEIKFQANVLYNSDNLIIAKDTPYSKPFVVIVNGNQSVGVCYGHIDFKELEIEDLNGSVGIKCNIRQVYDDPNTGEEVVVTNGIDVISSREAVRWSPSTREYLTTKFESAKYEATGMIEQELKQSDFLQWLKACKNITSYTGKDTALGRLSNIVDINSLRPKFMNTDIKFSLEIGGLFPYFDLKLHTEYQDKNDENKFKTKREVFDFVSSINFENFYFLTEDTATSSRYKEIYLCRQSDSRSFVTISPQSDDHIYEKVKQLVAKNKIKFSEIETTVGKFKAKRDLIIKLIQSSELYKNYSDITIPEDFKETLTKIEKGIAEKAESERVLTAAEIRELEERVVAHEYEARSFCYPTHHADTFKHVKIEPKFESIKNLKITLYYGFQVDETKLQYASHILYPQRRDPDKMGILLVSKSNKKHFKMHKHIDDFFGTTETIKDEKGLIIGTSIKMENKIVKWNTARIISEKMGDLSFFNNFSIFNDEMTELFNEISSYKKDNYHDMSIYANRVGVLEHHENFVKFLNKLMEFQLFLEDSSNDESSILEKAKDLAGVNVSENTKEVLVVDTDMLNKLDKLLAYAKPISMLLNNIEILTLKGNYKNYASSSISIPFELEMEIKEYIKLKHG